MANLLLVLLLLCYWKTDAACVNKVNMVPVLWKASVSDQSELDQFLEKALSSKPPRFVHLSLTGGNSYELDIIKLMQISVNGSLILESKDGLAEIDCMSSSSDLEGLRRIIQPLSCASLVRLNGIVFTGCPVPILIEEVSEVFIQNCVFKDHNHGALSIYNSKNITMKNCKFYNNTSDSYFTRQPYQGSSGGLSVGYHFINLGMPLGDISILITDCNFTCNIAAPPIRLKVTSTEALIRRLFPGRGAALCVLVNINSPLNFTLTNSVFLNNFADTFGGGVYCLTNKGSKYQTYVFANNVFTSNTAPIAGALSFINLLNRPVEFAVYSIFYNCTFIDNAAVLKVAGATSLYPLYAQANNVARFEDCKFYNNSAPIYGGAVDITTYSFFSNREAVLPVEFVNCIFDGNRAADGAAVNVAYYRTTFDNVSFSNNRQSAIRAIGGKMDFYDEINFVDNTVNGSVGGAIYLLSSSQMILEANANIAFVNNTGSSGAGIVVEIRRVLSVFQRQFHNPLCFLQYHNTPVPLSQIHHDNVTMAFMENFALVGSAVYADELDFCSWFSYDPPYFVNTSDVFRWPFISYKNNGQDASAPVQTPAIDFVIQNETISAYPGELIQLRIIPYDEQNFTAADMFEIRGRVNNSLNPGIHFAFSPTVRELHPADLNYFVKYSVKTEAGYVTDAILKSNYSIGVSAFRTQSFDQVKSFDLKVTPCPPGHVLHSTDVPDEYECKCNEQSDGNIISCLQNERKLVLKEGYWGHTVDHESINTVLEYYYCPPGYCQCTNVNNLTDVCSNVYHYYNDDLQCVCDRQDYLCGKCRNGKGVSAILNRCVSCGHVNVLFIVALVIVDIIVITVILLASVTLLPWLYPFLYFVQVTPHAALYFPAVFSVSQPYLHYINSAVSLYLPYDFCLYPGMTALVSYSFRYIPFLLAIVVFVVIYIVHRRFLIATNFRMSWCGLWSLIMLLYTDVVNTSVSVLNCPILTDYSGKKSLIWHIDGSVKCFTGGHAALATFAILVLGLCAVLVAVVAAVTIGKLQLLSLERCLKDPFTKGCHWWAPIELIRRFVFVVFVIIDPGNLIPVLLLTMAYLALYGYYQPYKSLYINVLEVVILADTIVLLMIAPTAVFEEWMPKNYHSFGVNDCGKATTINEHGAVLTLFYYTPLLLLLFLVSIKIAAKIKADYKCRVEKEDKENNKIGRTYTLVSQPATTFYLEFNDNHDLTITSK